jgi:hypothetical protein
LSPWGRRRPVHKFSCLRASRAVRLTGRDRRCRGGSCRRIPEVISSHKAAIFSCRAQPQQHARHPGGEAVTLKLANGCGFLPSIHERAR